MTLNAIYLQPASQDTYLDLQATNVPFPVVLLKAAGLEIKIYLHLPGVTGACVVKGLSETQENGN